MVSYRDDWISGGRVDRRYDDTFDGSPATTTSSSKVGSGDDGISE